MPYSSGFERYSSDTEFCRVLTRPVVVSQLAMSSLAFLLSTVVSKASTAVNLGFVVFVIGWIMQVAARSFPCLLQAVEVHPIDIVDSFVNMQQPVLPPNYGSVVWELHKCGVLCAEHHPVRVPIHAGLCGRCADRDVPVCIM
jgi:hypothetical protein